MVQPLYATYIDADGVVSRLPIAAWSPYGKPMVIYGLGIIQADNPTVTAHIGTLTHIDPTKVTRPAPDTSWIEMV